MPRWSANTLKVAPTGRNPAVVGSAFDFMFAATLHRAGARLAGLPKIERTGIPEFDRASRYHESMAYGQDTDAMAVARCCVFLAKLHDSAVQWNSIGRKGTPAFRFRPQKAEIQDVLSIAKLVNPAKFSAFGQIRLQPRFGRGAVGDILAGNDTIIDVKTTIHGTLTRLQFDQCLAYAMLTDLRACRIGIYFARYGELFLHQVSIDDMVRKRFRALFK